MDSEQEVPPPAAMMGLITGYWTSQAVGVVRKGDFSCARKIIA